MEARTVDSGTVEEMEDEEEEKEDPEVPGISHLGW